MEPNELWNAMEGWFSRHTKVVVAMSGGVDSSLVAYAGRQCLGRDNMVAVISASASLKTKDLVEARAFARQFDIPLVEIETDEMHNPLYLSNPVNRCYFCKTALYSHMDALLASRYPGYDVLNGSNLSDFGDYRPGLKAAEEHRVHSPLADCGFRKEEVRALARHCGLPNWNKPASPCLSSRFPYGEAIDREKLARVESAEDWLNGAGFDNVRVRFVQNLARVEVPAHRVAELRARFGEAERVLLGLGFAGAEIDEEGLVSGKLNRALPQDLSLMVRTTVAAK